MLLKELSVKHGYWAKARTHDAGVGETLPFCCAQAGPPDPLKLQTQTQQFCNRPETLPLTSCQGRLVLLACGAHLS